MKHPKFPHVRCGLRHESGERWPWKWCAQRPRATWGALSWVAPGSKNMGI